MPDNNGNATLKWAADHWVPIATFLAGLGAFFTLQANVANLTEDVRELREDFKDVPAAIAGIANTLEALKAADDDLRNQVSELRALHFRDAVSAVEAGRAESDPLLGTVTPLISAELTRGSWAVFRHEIDRGEIQFTATADGNAFGIEGMEWSSPPRLVRGEGRVTEQGVLVSTYECTEEDGTVNWTAELKLVRQSAGRLIGIMTYEDGREVAYEIREVVAEE